MARIVRLILVLCLTTVVVLGNGAAASVFLKTMKDGTWNTVVMENAYLKVIVYPELGGRIGAFIYKPTGKNLVFWDLSPASEGGGLGGALDDRWSTFAAYDMQVINDTPEAASIALRWDNGTIECSKVLTLRGGGPQLQVDYEFVNNGQKNLDEYEIMIRNFFTPSGAAVSPQDKYVIPTALAVRTFSFKTLQPAYPEISSKKFVSSLGAPWQSLLSTSDKTALSIVHQDDNLKWLYWWTGDGADYPTYEWVYKGIPAGQKTRARFWMTVAPGVDGVIDATKDYTAQLSISARDNDITLTTGIVPVRESLKDVVVKWSIMAPGGQTAVILPEQKIGDIPLVTRKDARAVWRMETDGPFIVHQEVYSEGKKLGEFEEPLDPTKTTGVWKRSPQFLASAKFESIPGWKRERQQEMEISPAAKNRGYQISLKEFAPCPEAWGKDVDSIALNMGMDEYESFSVVVTPTNDIKKIRVFTAAPFSCLMRVEELENVGNAEWGKPYLWAHKLIEKSEFVPEKGKDTVVWFTVKSHGLKPGLHTGTITIKPGGAPEKKIRVLMKVWSVKYPIRPLFKVETEHLFQTLEGIRKGNFWDVEIAKKYADDLVQHRTTVFQIYGQIPGVAAGKNGTYDFTTCDTIFSVAVAAGFSSFATNGGLGSPQEVQYFKDFYNYVRSWGFPASQTFVKTMDEQPPSTFPQLVALAKRMKELGWATYSSFHGQLSVPEHMKVLNPAFDMYQGIFSNFRDYRARIEEGLVDPSDEMWMYRGWGAAWYSYEQSLRDFWEQALLNTDGYHIHVYYRWALGDALIWPTANGPIGSAAWEGVRDGAEATNYYRLLQYKVERLSRYGGLKAKREAERVKSEMGRLFGEKKTALLRLVEQPEGLHLKMLAMAPGVTLARMTEAKVRVLELLSRLQRYEKEIPHDLFWGNVALIHAGKQKALIASTGPSATALAKRIKTEFGCMLPIVSETTILSDALNAPGFHRSLIVALVPGETSRIVERCGGLVAFGTAGKFPGPGRYAVKDIQNPWDKECRVILILGGDNAGVAEGVRNFVRLLTPYPVREILNELSITQGLRIQ